MEDRASGLVQRRRAAPKSEENNRGSPASDERNEDDDAGMDHDSKETRLTLMEEVLLLGLKDKASQESSILLPSSLCLSFQN